MDQDMKKKHNIVNTGTYNKNQEEYQNLVDEIYRQYSEGVTLTPEYAQFVQENLLRFFIRLARYKFVAKMLKSGDSVMEVGSGSGLGSMFLSQHCQHVTGIDVKTTEVDEARALNKRKNVDFLVQDIFKIPKKRKFDVVVSLDVIEHMPIELGHKFLRAKALHLNDNGMLIVGTPSIYSYQYQSPLSQASHVKCYDLPELLEMMDKYVQRTIAFSMNDELVHTGHHKMAWYYFVIGFGTKVKK
jgi:2-polyprenyl-3-methyl-5-hydroxy-6-metoxy-1,4-benzoquinol methylase